MGIDDEDGFEVALSVRISWQLLCSYQSEICFCSCLSISLTTGSQCTVLTQWLTSISLLLDLFMSYFISFYNGIIHPFSFCLLLGLVFIFVPIYKSCLLSMYLAINFVLILSASDLKKRAFCGARFSLALNLVLIIGLYDTNSELGEFLPVILKALKFIGPRTAKLSEPWFSYQLRFRWT
jgi:hypothetical protein